MDSYRGRYSKNIIWIVKNVSVNVDILQLVKKVGIIFILYRELKWQLCFLYDIDSKKGRCYFYIIWVVRKVVVEKGVLKLIGKG